MSSVTAVVSAGGRIFSIIDEGPRASIYLPPEWALVARDAFNGLFLWRQPIQEWHTHLFKLKSGPHQLARRLVATERNVYVTLGIGAPVSVIDAASGKVLRTIAGSEGTEEILHLDGKLVLRMARGDGGMSRLAVVSVDSGKTLWQSGDRKWTPLTLAADSESVYCHAVDRLYRFAMASGDTVWDASLGGAAGKLVSTNSGPGITLHEDSVVYASKRGIAVLAADTGEKRWQKALPISDYRSPTRVFVIDDLVWRVSNKGWDNNDWSNAKRKIENVFVGHDLMTGDVRKTIGIDGQQGEGIIHHRCYIPKAVGRHILTSWPGIEFVDTGAGTITQHNWLRGACLYGILPANGMIYVPAHPCVCYNQGKLNGFYAVSSSVIPRIPIPDRLERGPAYDSPRLQEEVVGDWCTYRGSPRRDGFAAEALDGELAERWTRRIGSRLTAPVISGGTVYLADVDTHTVHAVGANDGKPRWRFLADGPVDSPPTCYQGGVYFGCRDGYVYCLDAETGVLRWRFLAAKQHRQIVSYDRLESQWPLHGSVLITDGKLYAVAGRSAFLDGGMDLYCLDAATGTQLAVKRLCSLDENGRQPELTGHATDRLSMDTVAPDIPSSDGKRLFLRHKAYDLETLDETAGAPHLYSAMGFLDRDEFHRTFWAYDDGTAGARYAWQFGAGGRGNGPKRPVPFGSHLTVMNGTSVFHFGRKKALMSHHKNTEPFFLACYPKGANAQPRWIVPASMRIRAMVVAGQQLLTAGPIGRWRQNADGLTGKQGIFIRVHSIDDGETVAAYPLDAVPVADGLAVASGRLFAVLSDGRLMCLGRGGE